MMKKILAVVVGLVAAATMQIAVAQEQRPATPVEFYGCNWQDGKGMADLVKVGQKFSKWADKRDSKYSAWILTPQFQTDVGFDVGWLGGWPSGAEMGKTLDAWKSDGQELAADFNAVMDCSNRHELATVVEINAPNGPGGNGIVMFAACTVADGKTGADAIAAHAKAGAMMKGKGAKATSTWAFFPALGTGDYDFDYWRVITFDNYSDFGATSDIFINGGGWQESMKIMGGVTQCERGVIFDATVVRLVPAS
jgi:hypothetical protein